MCCCMVVRGVRFTEFLIEGKNDLELVRAALGQPTVMPTLVI